MLMSRRGSGSVFPALKAEFLLGAVIVASAGISGAHAASFGHSRIVSALGQPLHVEIPVTQLTEQEIATLKAVPAPAQAWSDVGMTPPVPLESMRLVLLDGYRPGVKVIQLRSSQPFNAPIVDVLLDITSSAGQQRYQVSLFAQADSNAVVRPGVENARNPRPIDGRPAAAPGSHSAAGASLRVQPGDTLFAIAQRNAVQGVTVYQMMMALHRNNRGAFIEDNVNLVKAGATLVMPDLDELTAISDREARRLFMKHVEAFNRYRQRGKGAGVGAMPAEGAIIEESAAAAPQGAATAAATEAPPQAGDRLRLSGGRDGTASTGAGGSGGSGASAAGSAAAGASLLASNGTIASDAVVGSAAHASGGDHSANGNASLGAIADVAVATAPDPSAVRDPDDDAALRKGVEESQSRIVELEDNLRHLNEALQKQGHVAAEAALEGARSVTEAIKEAIGIDDSTSGSGTSASGADAGSGGQGGGNGVTSAGGSAAAPSAARASGGSAGQSVSGAQPGSSASSAVAGASAPGAPEGAATGSNSGAAGGTGAGSGPVAPNGAGSGSDTAAGSAGTQSGAGAGSSAGINVPLPGAGTSAGSGSAENTSGSAASGAGPSAPSAAANAEESRTWLQQNLMPVVIGGLALLVFIIVWILRRAGASRRDAFQSDSPITDAMVREKLQGIDLELGPPPGGSADRNFR